MRRRTLVRIAGIAISLACLAYVFVRAAQVWDQAGPTLLEPDTFVRLGLALAPMTLAYVTAALAWIALLRSFGVHAAPLSTSGAYLAAQVGKYLPGNVGHYVGRVVLGTRVGLPASTVALAMTVEFGLLIAIAALLGLPMLQFTLARLGAAWHAPPSTQLMALAACLAVIAIVLLVIMRLRPALVHSLRAMGDAAARGRSAARAPFGRLGYRSASSMGGGGLTSSALLVLGEQAAGFQLSKCCWRVVSLYSVAWIVGALTPGAPGGIGVREAILIEGLTPLWGAGEAVAGALALQGGHGGDRRDRTGPGGCRDESLRGPPRKQVIPTRDVERRPLPRATIASGPPRAVPGSQPRGRQ